MGLFGSKTKQYTNQTQTNSAYAPYKPVIDQGASIMQGYLNNPKSTAVYGGPRVADLSGDTQAGQQMMRDSSGANDSMGFLSGVMNGGAGGMNPQVQQMQDIIRRQVMAANAAQFSNAGITGGTAHQGSVSRGLADGMAQPLFAAYENDMGRKMQAAGMLPDVDQQRIGNQLGAGSITDQYNQAKINADMQRFEESRTAPMRAWGEVAPMAGQMASQFGTQTSNGTTIGKNSQGIGSGIVGGLMAGAGLMSGIPGLGSAIGGGLFGGGGYQQPSTPYASNGSFNINNLFGGR